MEKEYHQLLCVKEPYKGDPNERFQCIKQIGEGSFGKVELCKDRENGDKLVVKKVAKFYSQSIVNEIGALYHICHKNIVKFIDYYQTSYDLEKPMYDIILEYAEGDNLMKYISQRLTIEEIILLKIADQICQALEYLNKNRCMHRDLKLDNILIDKYGDFKLSDFGTVNIFEENETHKIFTSQQGTKAYWAPEMDTNSNYTFDVDIYSLGMSLYFASVEEFVSDKNINQLAQEKSKIPISEQYSPQFKSLVESMTLSSNRAQLSNVKEIILQIETSKKLSSEDQISFDDSMRLFYGYDGIIDKEKAFSTFENLSQKYSNECAEPVFQLAKCYFNGDACQEDREKAIPLLQMASRKLSSPALKLLAFCYQYGICVEKDLFTTMQLLSIAKNKDPEASFLLGYNIYNSTYTVIENMKNQSREAIKQDYELAFHYFLQAKNYAPSQNYLGLCYLNGNGVKANLFEAYKYFSLSAEQGYLDGMYNLAEFYLSQKSDDPTYAEEAVKLLTEAADQYHMGAACKLSELYSEGKIVPQDDTKSSLYSEINPTGENPYDPLYSLALLKLNGPKNKNSNQPVEKDPHDAFIKFQLCSENHSGASYHLAQCYRDGIGTNKDIEKALELFEQSSTNEISDEMCDLALCYLNKESPSDLDKEKAFKLLQESSERGSLKATYWLAKCYLNGNYVKEDRDRAMSLLRTAHLGNYTEATYELACCLHSAKSVKDAYHALDEARELYQIAAAKGHMNAAYDLGMILLNSPEIFHDYQKAFKYFRIAANLNHPQAIIELARLYETGSGTRKNLHEAFLLYQKAANLGEISGTYHLALYYLNKNGTKLNYEKAKSLLEIASPKIPAAKYELGLLFLNGIGCQKDISKGIELLEEACKSGNVDAKIQLGKCYQYGIGYQQNYKKAYELIFQSSKSSNEGKFLLADYYMKGIGVGKREDESVIILNDLSTNEKYLPAIIKLGEYYIESPNSKEELLSKGIALLKEASAKKSAKAMTLLGICHYNGRYLQKSNEEAINYFKKASSLDDVLANAYLARLYIEGNGFPLLPEKGFKMLKELENQHNSEVNLLIGICYFKGAGVGIDKQKGLEYIKEAVDQENPNALCYYAKLIFKNLVNADKSEAKKLLLKASLQNHPESKYFLAKLLQDSKNEIERFQSYPLLTESSNLGSAKASYYLAKKCLVDPDRRDEGLGLLKKAAQLNHYKSLEELSQYYKNIDSSKAQELSIKANLQKEIRINNNMLCLQYSPNNS